MMGEATMGARIATRWLYREVMVTYRAKIMATACRNIELSLSIVIR